MKPKFFLHSMVFVVSALLCSVDRSFPESFEPQQEHGVDRPGADYRNFDLEASNPKVCRSACADDKQCRAWTYVKPGVQGSKARCWLKTIAPTPRVNSCCTSGAINVLREIQACRDIDHAEGKGPVTCVGPGGRDFGKAGKTFKKGDKVIILARFRRLHLGDKKLSAVYSRAQSGKFVNFSENKKVLKFKNESESWAYWFPAHFT
ncbi:MAG: PAN domain-containing protein, partial [Nitrospiraceae bacterium]